MLDIFGSDSTKKKKGLRENMDKIRDMVEDDGDGPQIDEGQQSPQQPQPAGDRQQQSTVQHDQQSRKSQQGSQDPVQAQEGQSRKEQRSQNTQTQQSRHGGGQQGRRQQDQDVEMTRRDEKGTRTQTRSTQDQQRQAQQERGGQGRRRQQGQGQQTPAEQERGEVGLSSDDIPEPPETREIEVPDIQKGPLFIRVRKFKEAKQMVSRMRELNEDMETQMGGLRNTLQEDDETTRRLNDAMKRLQDSMNTIRDIVSPG